MPASVDVGSRISGVTWYEMHTTRKADGKGTLVGGPFQRVISHLVLLRGGEPDPCMMPFPIDIWASEVTLGALQLQQGCLENKTCELRTAVLLDGHYFVDLRLFTSPT